MKILFVSLIVFPVIKVTKDVVTKLKNALIKKGTQNSNLSSVPEKLKISRQKFL